MIIKSPLIRKILLTEKYSIEELFSMRGKVYTYVNPVSYLTALRNKGMFNTCDGMFVDGSIFVAAMRMFYGEKVTRRSFDMTSMAPLLLEYANKHLKSICVIASKQEHVEKAIDKFKAKYPLILWCECRGGYFTSLAEMEAVAKKVADEQPDFLIVGMGVKLQEYFLLMCKKAGYQGVGFTCGGFIHQVAMNELNYYPKWIDRMNLRFFYRMYKEKHTRKRYLQAAFLFPVRFIGERFFG